jgi:hypothetical protein
MWYGKCLCGFEWRLISVVGWSWMYWVDKGCVAGKSEEGWCAWVEWKRYGSDDTFIKKKKRYEVRRKMVVADLELELAGGGRNDTLQKQEPRSFIVFIWHSTR